MNLVRRKTCSMGENLLFGIPEHRVFWRNLSSGKRLNDESFNVAAHSSLNRMPDRGTVREAASLPQGLQNASVKNHGPSARATRRLTDPAIAHRSRSLAARPEKRRGIILHPELDVKTRRQTR